MTLLETHPDLPSERAYVQHAYECMEAMYERVSSLGAQGRNDFEKMAFEAWRTARQHALSDKISALVFGRIDTGEQERFYIGRHHIGDRERRTVVVDWRAPVARAFYRAGHADPLGLLQRRQFLTDGRDLLGLSDEVFAEDGPIDLVRAREIVQAELQRQSPGRMRDIVATIQAEQDAIIRAPLEGIVVVQGGPGTGKTAVGLHRASYLIYEHREELTKHKVLVAGPNKTFMAYISQVLPSLGETAVVERTVDELAPLVRTGGRDEPAVERIKGDARMATVLERALAARRTMPSEPIDVQAQGARIQITPTEVESEAARIRGMGVPWKRGRTMLRDSLVMASYRRYQENLRTGMFAQDFDAIAKEVKTHPSFKAALSSVWPSVAPTTLVRSVLRNAGVLAEAAGGVLTDEEQALLRRRTRGVTSKVPWADADRPLLDEAAALIEEPEHRYAHVVIDEAQDLSPMRLRMLARRTRDGSMTVLGDLGQASGAWGARSWQDVLAELPDGASGTVEELTLGYRVAPAIMEVAARVLAASRPDLRAPDSVRAERGRVDIAPTDDLAPDVARLAPALLDQVDFAAVIAPDDLIDAITAALAVAGVAFRDARSGEIGGELMVVPASMAKGLEFDGVLLVEPAGIVAQANLNLLYICITRAMRHVVIAHAAPLPDPLVATASARSA